MRLKKDAIFIADAHYPHHNNHLIKLLNLIKSQKIKTDQIFFMGDIFDLLIGNGEYLYEYNKEAIELINQLSKTKSIIYLEGNHDFYLKNLFPDINIIPRTKQPLSIYDASNNRYCLAHGDKYETSFIYNIYSSIIRHPAIISILLMFEEKVSKIVISKLKQKSICNKIDNFQNIIKKISLHYPDNATIIEAHFHQGVKIDRYISLPSLACDNRYTIFRDGEFIFQDI